MDMPLHFYVYYFKRGRYVFDRTMGTQEAARCRVQELERLRGHALFVIDHLINGAYY